MDSRSRKIVRNNGSVDMISVKEKKKINVKIYILC